MSAPTLKAAVKAAIAGAAFHSGVLSLWNTRRLRAHGPRVHVLGFHRVVDDLAALGGQVIPSLCVSTRGFARMMDLARKRFEILSLDEAAEALAGRRPLARDALAITFDDGYRDVYLRARPVLQDLGLPATVFVPTGLAGTDRPLTHDRLYALLARARAGRRDLCAAPAPKLLRPALARAEAHLYSPPPSGALDALEHLIGELPAVSLSRICDALDDLLGAAPSSRDPGSYVMGPDELRACADAGIALGAHTVEHVVLTHEPPSRVQRELARPRRDLEAWSGRPCTAFAYCNGLHSPSLRESVRAAGYTVAVTTTDAPNPIGQDPLRVARKCLWDGHLRGPLGHFSTSQAAAHLHDLYGALGLTRPVDGERAPSTREAKWQRSA